MATNPSFYGLGVTVYDLAASVREARLMLRHSASYNEQDKNKVAKELEQVLELLAKLAAEQA